MNTNRPKTQLFMLMSVDGKISTGDNDERDVDKDFPKISGAREGLHQYYEIESHTDILSLNTGRVMAKIGVNERPNPERQIPVTFVIIDNQPHLEESGVRYMTKWAKGLILVTTNEKHPALKLQEELDNLKIESYKGEIDFADLFNKLKEKYGFKRLTIQSGGTLNSILLRAGLVDKLSIVVAPVIIGGKDTSTLIDGESLHTLDDLAKIKPLKLAKAEKLKNSYLHLKYDVLN